MWSGPFPFWGLSQVSMWLPSTEILVGPDAPGQSIFLAQLWHELLSTNSPDSFRAKALDLPLLMEELFRICRYAQQEPKWISHVHLICEEIKSQRTTLVHVPLPPIAESALASISNFNLGAPELPRLIEQIRIFLDLQRQYLGALLTSVQAIAPDVRQKKRITAEMGALATHIQSRGGSDESLSKIDNALCGLSPTDVVQSLCGDVNRVSRDYPCYISIAAPRSIASRLFANTSFKEVGANTLEGNETAKLWYQERSVGIVVEWRVQATSRQKAGDLALSEVFKLIHLHALYSNNVLATASPRVLVEDGGTFYVVDITPSRHFGLEPRRDSERLSRMRYNSLHGRLKGRLANLLESHALAVSASDARSAVFHLWTALETLVSGLGSGSIGERVADVVAPIVAWRRTDKIATYLAICGHELRAHTGATYDLTHFPNSSTTRIDKADIFKAVSGVENNPAVLGAFSAFAPSPLLVHRLYRAWEECNNPAELRKALLLSRNRIKWQVMRFYRARNLLVHYGEIDNLATRLLENAQYYLSTCVGRVLHDLTNFDQWDVNTSLEFHRQRLESLLDRLQTKPQLVRMDELLVHAQSSYASDLVWPTH